MGLHDALERRAATRPVRVALIGLGAFGQMFAAQVPRTPGLHLAAVADLDVPGARARLTAASWPAERAEAPDLDRAIERGTTFVTDDVARVLGDDRIDVVVEATGDAAAGVAHAQAAIDAGRDLVMVNVEADVLAGPLLAQRAEAAGTIYSLAYGDQPALICELVDWARTAGLRVLAAGKGTRYLPAYEVSTPDTVWEHYDLDPDRARAAGFNPQMFNSFLDGTKSAIEMTAVANATGLAAPVDGLAFPPAGVADLPALWAARAVEGAEGVVEVVSSLTRDGVELVDDLRWGVFVVFAADDAYVAARFADYGVRTDPSGRVAALHRPCHLIGLELGISVASVALRREATGAPTAFRADAVAIAKRSLRPGDRLDGEGGYTVRGTIRPASVSLAAGLLPIGLARDVNVTRPVPEGAPLRWADVEIDDSVGCAAVRRALEDGFADPRAPSDEGANGR